VVRLTTVALGGAADVDFLQARRTVSGTREADLSVIVPYKTTVTSFHGHFVPVQRTSRGVIGTSLAVSFGVLVRVAVAPAARITVTALITSIWATFARFISVHEKAGLASLALIR